ncbi:MAG TPA: transcription antitermination factor NusB, partial [Candidatus Cloacimonas sp.]|nr:transcription antitermination factor NusB [Candidatus Cloacimonas sp.]
MNFRSEAYSTILKVLKDKEYSDSLLHQRARKLKNAGEDPALFYNLVKGVIKLYLKLDYILQQYVDKKKFESTDIKIKTLLYIGLYQLMYLNSIPEHAAVNETVELAKNLFNEQVADFVNAVLRSYLRNPEVNYPQDPVLRIAYEHSFAPELIQQWLNLWGEENTEYLAMFFNENPELHIRVNNT